eukprot:TRINITY_DN1386_c0_g1_i8.p2 TRINITY_DN1386_c0_g1~~TRINITY_DN1386_c0_g1_i8.p2  ORF type:complete len:128 (-),score=8.61 TRINITY_DN1386_c0_g1_i8:16-399(-)
MADKHGVRWEPVILEFLATVRYMGGGATLRFLLGVYACIRIRRLTLSRSGRKFFYSSGSKRQTALRKRSVAIDGVGACLVSLDAALKHLKLALYLTVFRRRQQDIARTRRQKPNFCIVDGIFQSFWT